MKFESFNKKSISLHTKAFCNVVLLGQSLYIFKLWHVQTVQLLMAERQKGVKIMGLAAPIAATNFRFSIGCQI
jgi:hypothetical protein